MPSSKQDIQFLQEYLKWLIKTEKDLLELAPSDIVPASDDTPPITDEKAERAARLADDNGFDGNIFRNLWGYGLEPAEWILTTSRYIRKQIATIPRIIAKIEKTDKTEQGWHIENGQVFYDGTDLQFPTGQIQEVLKKLVDSEGKTVLYEEFEKITTQEKYRHYIADIRKRLKGTDIPYEIKTVTYEGYKLQKK